MSTRKRPNLNSLVVPHPPDSLRSGTAPATSPQPLPVIERVERCEGHGLDLDARISQLSARVSELERAILGEERG